MIIGVIGGTGNLGYGLAIRWAKAGHQVMIGSRDKSKAQAAADKIRSVLPTARLSGAANEQVAQQSDIIVLSIPFSGHKAILSQIKQYVEGKIVLSTTVPMIFKNNPLYDIPEAGSAGEDVKNILPNAKIVSGLHTVSAGVLTDLDDEIECDALVCGDDKEAKQTIIQLGEDIGLKVFDVGSLEYSQYLERQTPLVISLNKRYKRKHIGLQLTGI